ncbi:MAG: protein kinase [Planctomycetota bacterium]
MGLNISDCPSDVTWREFLDDLCNPEQRPSLEQHLDDCEHCQTRLESMTADPEWKQWMPDNQQVQVDTAVALQDDTTLETKHAPPEIAKPDIPGYTILERIGRGGMGAVYRAHQQGLNRFVAIKVLSTSAEQNPERWVRFRTEAEAAGRLVHPNIIRVFDSGEHNNVPHVVQELAEDGSLASRVKGAPQSTEQTIQWMIPIADAVEHAHQQGVLHRDIKPSNLLFAGDTIKLADFGLAKLTDGQDVTETHGVIVTPAYMAPEQAVGDRDSIGPGTDQLRTGTDKGNPTV